MKDNDMKKYIMFSVLLVAVVVTLATCYNGNAVDDNGEQETTNEGDSAAESDRVRLYIGPELVDCVGVAPQLCLQVSESGHADYEFFYDRIEGFEPIVGTRYVIDVEVTEIENPPADASSLNYRLLEVVEQEIVAGIEG